MASPEGQEAAASPERKVKSCKRTCTTCGYSLIDTALGQAMMKAMEEVKRKQKAEEKRNWAALRACKERGEEKSRLEWEHFRARELEEKAARALAKSKSEALLHPGPKHTGPLYRDPPSDSLLASVMAQFSAGDAPMHWRENSWRMPSRNWDL